MRPDIDTAVEGATAARPRRHRTTVAAFQAVVEERLRNLEGEVAEVKGRINGLIFLIAGTVAAQVLLRLFQ